MAPIHTAAADGNLAALMKIICMHAECSNAASSTIAAGGGSMGGPFMSISPTSRRGVARQQQWHHISRNGFRYTNNNSYAANGVDARRRGMLTPPPQPLQSEEDEQVALVTPIPSMVGKTRHHDTANSNNLTNQQHHHTYGHFHHLHHRSGAHTPATNSPNRLQPPSYLDKRDKADMTPLLIAVERGHTHIVAALIDARCDVNLASGYWTPLHLAAREGRAEIVALLVAGGAATDATVCGWTPLHLAARNGHAEVVKTLIASNSKPTPSCGNAASVLEFAALTGNIPTVTALLDAGYSPRNVSSHGFTALFYAIRSGNTACVKLLLGRGRADPNVPLPCGSNALHMACRYGSEELARLFLGLEELTTTIATSSTSPSSPTITALSETAEGATLEGANIQQDRATTTTTTTTTNQHGTSAPPPLLRCDVNSTNTIGAIPLQVAIEEGHLGLVQLLIDCGSSVDAKLTTGMAPLHTAVHRRDTQMIAALLAAGCDASSMDAQSNTAELIAVQMESEAAVRDALLEGGCHPHDHVEEVVQMRKALAKLV